MTVRELRIRLQYLEEHDFAETEVYIPSLIDSCLPSQKVKDARIRQLKGEDIIKLVTHEVL